MLNIKEDGDVMNTTGKMLARIFCASTDTKPTNYAGGSLCTEYDTGATYMFDEDAKEWVAYPPAPTSAE